MSEIHLPTQYHLRSIVTGNKFEDTNWILEASGEPTPSLLSSIYDKKQLELKDAKYGIYQFADWLPIHRILEGSSAPVTYKSEEFASLLGLQNLYITFSGYWPERGALMRTCSFKETEAYSVCARMRPEQDQILVVASAGNTGPDPMTIGVPGNVPYVITVGAMTDNYTPADSSDDRLSSFSAAGPTYEGFVKPEMVAPGGHVISMMNDDSQIAMEHPEFHDDVFRP